MADDPTTGDPVLFGGFAWTCSDTLCGDTWTWNGSAWSQASSVTTPSPRSDSVAALDVRKKELVLFGGDNGAVPVAPDTWLWKP
jgi:hypothetical protein